MELNIFKITKKKNGRIEEIKSKNDSNVGSFLLFHPVKVIRIVIGDFEIFIFNKNVIHFRGVLPFLKYHTSKLIF
jgi:hypothetical protein